MRVEGEISYVLADHLGSASVTLDASGNVQGEMRYFAYGAMRDASGYAGTDRLFTGQREVGEIGLYHYGARFYSPLIRRFISADTVVPEQGRPQDLNRYSYVRNNPLVYNDPSGHLINLVAGLIGGAIGAVIGAATVAVPQMINNIRDGEPLTANIDPVEVGKAAAVGAVAGVVGGLTFGAALAVAPTVGLGTGLAAHAAAGAVSGVAAGRARRLTENALDPERGLFEDVYNPGDILADAALGAVSGSLVYGAKQAVSGVAQRLMQRTTDRAVGDLARNSSLGRELLSDAERAAAQGHVRVAPMQCGNAVERQARNIIQESRVLRSLFRPVGGAGNPDFVGRGVFSGLDFDITTNTVGSIASHAARSYGNGLLYGLYNRPQGFMAIFE